MKSQFEIPFVGLKIGIHDFEFKIDKTFFEAFPYSIVNNGDVKVWMELEKKESMMVADFEFCGTVKIYCSRCNDEMDLEIEGELTIYFTFGEEDAEDENLIVIPHESYQIDVMQPIYEMISTSISLSPVHDDGECNKEMIKLIDKFQNQSRDEVKNEDNIDPRWSALKNLN